MDTSLKISPPHSLSGPLMVRLLKHWPAEGKKANENTRPCFQPSQPLCPRPPPRRVHISSVTLEHLNGSYKVEPGDGQSRDSYLKEHGVLTFLVVNPKVRWSCEAFASPTWTCRVGGWAGGRGEVFFLPPEKKRKSSLTVLCRPVILSIAWLRCIHLLKIPAVKPS